MAGKGKRSKREEMKAPTPEQMRDGGFAIVDVVDKQANGRTITLGKTMRRTPMIDILFARGMFSAAEHKALHHYRHHADLVGKSPVRDSLCIERFGGGGHGPTVAMLTAAQIVRACEAAAGSLRDVLRAVVVDDRSLSQVAIERSGAIEDCEVKRGQKVCRLKPRQNAVKIAKLEIQMAAKRVQAELAA